MKPKASANERRLAKLLREADEELCSFVALTERDCEMACAAFLAKRGVLAVCAATVPERLDRELEAAAREVWISVPSSYDDNDPLVRRHAAALCALGRILTRLEADRGK